MLPPPRAPQTTTSMMAVKSPSDFVLLWTAHARKQFDTMIAQSKALTELAQKVTTEIAEPLKASATKVAALTSGNDVVDGARSRHRSAIG
jgi:hypothetical protein